MRIRDWSSDVCSSDLPRVTVTVEAIRRDLVEDGLVLRYRPERAPDGLEGTEGTFLVCSFWLADALTMVGLVEEATELFERLLSLRNDLEIGRASCRERVCQYV